MKNVLVEAVKNIKIVAESNMELYDIKKKYSALLEKINNILENEKLIKAEEKLQEVEIEKQKSGFWDDAKTALVVLKKESQIKNDLNKRNSLTECMDDMDVLFELYEENEVSIDDLVEKLDEVEKAYKKLELNILLSGERDNCSILLEINPGAGGTESQDWANMLYDMYMKYFKKNEYKVSILNYQTADEAGIKNATLQVEGNLLYGMFKKESGVHRLVRISPFDSAKKRHTSFASVKVTPIIEDEIKVEINNSDLKIDTFRSSGAGGQSVNTTDSAVRILHIPTNISVTCQNERSQIKNREIALKLLKIKIYNLEIEKRKQERQELNKDDKDISFGSQKRSYVLHPYKMVKDYESKFETSQAEKVLNGDLDDFLYHNIIS